MAQIPQNRQFQEAKVPSHWGTSERRYAQGVNDLFERLFYMFGRLSKDDLAKPLNKEITDATGNILRIESDVDQVQLTLTTVQGDVSTLTLSAQEFATRLSNAEGDISTLEQTAQGLQTEVTNAKGDISGLQQTAQGLQTQVNNLGNRNRTYLPSTVPSVSERVEGDLLIDTANGNILKRWNGSAWAAVQDGAISIAQQQADKIQWLVASGTSATNMTLTSQLYSLMAANIDLSANNSIKLAVTSNSDNLIQRTIDFDTSVWEHYKTGGAVIEIRPSVAEGYFVVDAWPSSNYGYLRQNITGLYVQGNTDYVFSMDYTYLDVGCYIELMPKDSDGNNLPGYHIKYGVHNGPYSVAYKTPPSTASVRITIFAAQGTYMTGLKPCLTRGTLNKGWSPHPKDPASGVKTSNVTIDGTGIAMTTGGTFTTTSQNFNIDAAGNVVMKGTVEAASGKIGGFTISENKLVDTATGGTKAQFDPVTGTLILNDLEITQEADAITFRSRFVSKLRYFDFSNPNGSIVFRTANPTNGAWMTRFDVEMPTAAKPDGRTYNYGDSYIDGNCSAQSFTDRTPAYFGDALDELRWASGSKAKGIDHSSLPKFAQKTIIGTRINEDGEKEDYEEEGRDLGAMVSVLTRAVQQLADKVDSQQRLIEDLNRRVST